MTPNNPQDPKTVDPAEIAKRLDQWETLFRTHLEAQRRAPELQRLREEAIAPKFAILATRIRALR